MTSDRNDEAGLEQVFATARHQTPGPSEALMARVLADAYDLQSAQDSAAPHSARRLGPLEQMRRALGGWGGVGGLVAACAAGVWIGVALPAAMPDPAEIVGIAQPGVDIIGGGDLIVAMAEDGS